MAAILVMVVGLLIGAAIIVFTVLNPPSAPASSPAADDAGHSETSVRQAAQLVIDTYSSGSYGEFWDMWTTEAQGLIAREEYVRLFQLCPPPGPSTPFTITEVTVTGDDAEVQTTRPNETLAFHFVFETGSWRSVPSPTLRQDYQTKTVEQMVQERQAAGSCGTATVTPPATPPADVATTPPVTPPTTPPVIPPATPPTGSTPGSTPGSATVPSATPPTGSATIPPVISFTG
ncbi:hypothetical protein [Streptosporangium lutulentum]|uniref:Uncharacterized protein n=1 Tax=Streptosporangium lutulentum TaxID=1461250 RepID=A0ABT9QN01_9ACTN|nr:hypothetical protein [Streptosporangium lutulentum]MDP9847776.1 hypothetical protein [Streptosporangium lutulentum]